MTQCNEGGGQNRIGRMLSLMGGLLQEAGSLVQTPATGEGPVEKASGATVQASPSRAAPAPEPDSRPVESAPADSEPPQARASDPASREERKRAENLFLVCEHPGGKIVFPWDWLTGTRLSSEGDLEGFAVSDGSSEVSLRIDRVLGLWTRREIEAWVEPLKWLNSAAEIEKLPERVPGPPEAAPVSPSRVTPSAEEAARGAPFPPLSLEPSLGQPTAVRGRTSAPPAPQPLPAVAAASARPVLAHPAIEGRARIEAIASPAPSVAGRLCVASPSALARRFLMRHLCDLGFEVLEARDLDDPVLPADLGGVTALFLDESLLEDWKTRPVSMRGAPPLVCLTVDGDLRVPPDGVRPPGGAVLPRPFERAQVERVVHWLRSLQKGRVPEGNGDHGEEDDTWLFADPFRASRAGEHSRR